MFLLKKTVDLLHEKLKIALTFFIEKGGPPIFFGFCIFSILIEIFFVHTWCLDNHAYVSPFLLPGFIIVILALRLLSFLLSDVRRLLRFAGFLAIVTLIKYVLYHYTICQPTNDSFLQILSDKLSESLNRTTKHKVEACRLEGSVNALQLTIYSQLAIPIPAVLGWEVLLKNPEIMMKYTTPRLTGIAMTSAAFLTLIRLGNTNQLVTVQNKVVTEESLQQKYRYLEELVREKPGLQLSTEMIHDIKSYSLSKIYRTVQNAKPIVENLEPQQFITIENASDFITGVGNVV